MRSTRFSNRRRALVLAVALVVIVALFGGSSRFDQIQLLVLRPAMALLLIPALLLVIPDNRQALRVPLYALFAMALLTVLQLVPLPPGLWTALPGREPVAALDEAVGLAGTWRPISLAPFRTSNALAAMIVPLAALLGYAAIRHDRRWFVHFALIAVAVASAMLGFAQIASGGEGALYFYEVTNVGSPVGLFSNRNHSAIFGALALLSVAYLHACGSARFRTPQSSLILLAVFLLILSASLINESRMGLMANALAVLASIAMVAVSGRKRITKAGRSKMEERRRIALRFALFGLPALGLIGVFLASSRIAGLQRFWGQSALDDQRWTVLPRLWEMLQTYSPVGIGFGAFEDAYYIHERREALSPVYFNQAHNDWLQFPIEGGLPAVIVLALFLVWLVRLAGRRIGEGTGSAPTLVYLVSAATILAAGSAVDYVLRTPLFQFFGAWLIASLATQLPAGESGRQGSGIAREKTLQDGYSRVMVR